MLLRKPIVQVGVDKIGFELGSGQPDWVLGWSDWEKSHPNSTWTCDPFQFDTNISGSNKKIRIEYGSDWIRMVLSLSKGCRENCIFLFFFLITSWFDNWSWNQWKHKIQIGLQSQELYIWVLKLPIWTHEIEQLFQQIKITIKITIL